MDINAIKERVRATAGVNSAKYNEGFELGQREAAEDLDHDDLVTISSLEPGNLVSGDDQANRVAFYKATGKEFHDDYRTTDNFIRGYIAGVKSVADQVLPDLQ